MIYENVIFPYMIVPRSFIVGHQMPSVTRVCSTIKLVNCLRTTSKWFLLPLMLSEESYHCLTISHLPLEYQIT